MKERIEHILSEINQGIYEKDTEISLSLLAALAGESILLLGPPGVAKSMVARKLKEAFSNAHAFEYLMSRFSTPDEIFGPVSISRLKEEDKYERRIEGYLPTADVIFLDEIWKAGPAIQNTLLTVINEKLFRNGDRELALPLKLLIAASNELPTQGEGLEALWDRFLIRIICTCVKEEKTFYQMLLDETEGHYIGKDRKNWQITTEEYAAWQKAIKQVKVKQEVLTCITSIRKALHSILIEETEIRRNVYVSDRRWKNIVKLLKASAFMHGRTEVSLIDLLPIYHCLWNEPGERDEIRHQVIRAIFADYEKELTQIAAALKADLRTYRVKEAIDAAHLRGDHKDDHLAIVDYFYYQLEKHGTGNTFIFITDYRNLTFKNPENAPMRGLLYTDPQNPKRTIIRTFGRDNEMEGLKYEDVLLCRDEDHVYINGVQFAIRKLKRGEQQQMWTGILPTGERDYEGELETLSINIRNRIRSISENLFASEEDKRCITQHTATLSKGIAWARVDMRKLKYGDE